MSEKSRFIKTNRNKELKQKSKARIGEVDVGQQRYIARTISLKELKARAGTIHGWIQLAIITIFIIDDGKRFNLYMEKLAYSRFMWVKRAKYELTLDFSRIFHFYLFFHLSFPPFIHRSTTAEAFFFSKSNSTSRKQYTWKKLDEIQLNSLQQKSIESLNESSTNLRFIG